MKKLCEEKRLDACSVLDIKNGINFYIIRKYII